VAGVGFLRETFYRVLARAPVLLRCPQWRAGVPQSEKDADEFKTEAWRLHAVPTAMTLVAAIGH